MKRNIQEIFIKFLLFSLIALPWSCTESSLKVLDHCCFEEEEVVNTATQSRDQQLVIMAKADSLLNNRKDSLSAKISILTSKITILLDQVGNSDLSQEVDALRKARSAFNTSRTLFLSAVDRVRSEYENLLNKNFTLIEATKAYNICLYTTCHKTKCPTQKANVTYFEARISNYQGILTKINILKSILISCKDFIKSQLDISQQEYDAKCPVSEQMTVRCDEPGRALGDLKSIISAIDVKIVEIRGDSTKYTDLLKIEMKNKVQADSLLNVCEQNP